MKARYRIAGIGILVILLALIRYFQESLFYDPLLQFFASDYLQGETPHFETTGLLINVFYRFILNSVISLAIIYIAFMDGNILKFSFFLYLILFGIGFPVFMFLIFTIENNNFLALFYVRRFLIHSVFSLVQQKSSSPESIFIPQVSAEENTAESTRIFPQKCLSTVKENVDTCTRSARITAIVLLNVEFITGKYKQ